MQDKAELRPATGGFGFDQPLSAPRATPGNANKIPNAAYVTAIMIRFIC